MNAVHHGGARRAHRRCAARSTCSSPRSPITWPCCAGRPPTPRATSRWSGRRSPSRCCRWRRPPRTPADRASCRSSGSPTPDAEAARGQDPRHPGRRGRRRRQPRRLTMQTFAEAYNPAYTGEITRAQHRAGADAPGRAQGDRPPRRDVPVGQRGGEPRHRHPRGDRGGGRRGAHPRPDHVDRRGRRHRRHPGRRPELRRRHQRRRRSSTSPTSSTSTTAAAWTRRSSAWREADAEGNVNVSRFGRGRRCRRLHQHQPERPQAVFFLGTFTAGARASRSRDGALVIDDDRRGTEVPSTGSGRSPSTGDLAVERGQSRLLHHRAMRPAAHRPGSRTGRGRSGHRLRERDVLAHMGFRPVVATTCARWTRPSSATAPMGLRDRPPVGMDERFRFDRADRHRLRQLRGPDAWSRSQDADELAAELERRFADLGQRVHVVVNYDNFDLGPAAAPPSSPWSSARGTLLPLLHPVLDQRLLPPPVRP